jgi:DNA-directed RNA polymerase subunit RPC12/RpoP
VTVDDFRRRLGLRVYKAEIVRCLGLDCGKDFLSFDKTLNRICPDCRAKRVYPEFVSLEDADEELGDNGIIEFDPDYWDFINDNEDLLETLEKDLIYGSI